MLAKMLAPAAVLVCWSLLVLLWLMFSRGKAMSAIGASLKQAPPGGRGQDLEGRVAPAAQWKSHNYSHLMEQPTIFYPVVVILALTGAGAIDVALAWAYALIRIVHSLWQGTVYTIPVRFGLFLAATLCLMILAVRAAMATLFADPLAIGV